MVLEPLSAHFGILVIYPPPPPPPRAGETLLGIMNKHDTGFMSTGCLTGTAFQDRELDVGKREHEFRHNGGRLYLLYLLDSNFELSIFS